MKARCYSPCIARGIYKKENIQVCDRWRNSFDNFIEDMGEAPENYSIDRINNLGDYCPENCRWADNIIQSKNKSSTLLYEIDGEKLCLKDIAKKYNIKNQELMELFHVEYEKHEEPVYGTEVMVALNGEFLGYLVIADTVKAEAQKAISQLKKSGLKTVMLTGDTLQCAEEIAKETGVEEYYAKLLPEDKLEKVKEIREQYGPVMFVGDGINDAPVLAGADVGAAMGSGADAAIEAADVVFMTSSMEAIPTAISLAKITNRIAMQNVIFALVIKGLVMILGLLGFANMWMAVFADTGVAMLCVLNSVRILRRK